MSLFFICATERLEWCHLHSSVFRLTLLPLALASFKKKKIPPLTDGPAACLDICLPLHSPWQEEVWLQCDRLPQEHVLTPVRDISAV